MWGEHDRSRFQGSKNILRWSKRALGEPGQFVLIVWLPQLGNWPTLTHRQRLSLYRGSTRNTSKLTDAFPFFVSLSVFNPAYSCRASLVEDFVGRACWAV